MLCAWRTCKECSEVSKRQRYCHWKYPQLWRRLRMTQGWSRRCPLIYSSKARLSKFNGFAPGQISKPPGPKLNFATIRGTCRTRYCWRNITESKKWRRTITYRKRTNECVKRNRASKICPPKPEKVAHRKQICWEYLMCSTISPPFFFRERISFFLYLLLSINVHFAKYICMMRIERSNWHAIKRRDSSFAHLI